MINKYVGPEKYLFIFTKSEGKCGECNGPKLIENRLEKVLLTFLEVTPNPGTNEFTTFKASLHGHSILDKSYPNNNLVWYLSE